MPPRCWNSRRRVKRGVVELSDVIVVNKADGDRVTAAKRAAGDYRHALRMLPPATPGWQTPVLTMSAQERTGITELWDAVLEHRALLEQENGLVDRRVRQELDWLHTLRDEAVLAAFHARAGVAEALLAAEAEVTDGSETVPQVVQALVSEIDVAS